MRRLSGLRGIAAAAATAVALAAHGATPPGEPTLAAREWTAIQRVISDQLRALKAGDAAKAFSFASPGIRAQFETPAKFLGMVETSYSALTAARYTEFLEGAVIGGRVIQPLRLVAPDNTVLVALYTMERQQDGRWRIAGCVLAPSTVHAAEWGAGAPAEGKGERPITSAASGRRHPLANGVGGAEAAHRNLSRKETFAAAPSRPAACA